MFINDLFVEILGKYPITLIDIGASGGIQLPWKLLDKNLEVVGFEPDKAAFDELLEKDSSTGIKQKYLNTALYNENTSIELYITRLQGHSSIFKPDSEMVKRFSFSERYDVL